MERAKNGLEINQDMRFQRRMWRAERVGWVLMFLFVATAVLGYFGKGGLLVSEKTAGGPGPGAGLQVKYEPYLRQEVVTKLRVVFYNPEPEQRLLLNQSFLEDVRITQITPEPAGAVLSEAGTTYTFSTGGRQSEVVVYFEPQKTGSLQTKLSNGSSTLSLNQFVYP